eukprot:11325843-Alexandrium_andersonii.AAC.1
MSASLVGSEMCIRDSIGADPGAKGVHGDPLEPIVGDVLTDKDREGDLVAGHCRRRGLSCRRRGRGGA